MRFPAPMAAARVAAAAAMALVLHAGPAVAGNADPSADLGEIKHFAGDFVPRGWAACEGASLSVAQHVPLYAVLGTTFGMTMAGATVGAFNLPTLPAGAAGTPARPRPVICVDGAYPAPGQGAPGPDAPGGIRRVPRSAARLPSTGVPCRGQTLGADDAWQLLGMRGDAAGDAFQVPDLPAEGDGRLAWVMSTVGDGAPGGFLGDVRRWPASLPVPTGWVACDGARLPSNRNQALYAILGDKYGGDGRTWFAVPTLPDEGGARWILCTTGLFPSPY